MEHDGGKWTADRNVKVHCDYCEVPNGDKSKEGDEESRCLKKYMFVKLNRMHSYQLLCIYLMNNKIVMLSEP